MPHMDFNPPVKEQVSDFPLPYPAYRKIPRWNRDVIFHTHSRSLFKVTVENDAGKGNANGNG